MIRIPGGINHVGHHPHRCRREAFEWFEIHLELVCSRGHDRQLVMAIDQSPSMPWNVLDNADYACGGQAIENRAAERSDLHRLRAECAVADDVARTFLAYIEQRQRVYIDADVTKHQPDRAGVRACSLDRGRRGELV